MGLKPFTCTWCGANAPAEDHQDGCPESKRLRQETMGRPAYAVPTQRPKKKEK